MSNLVLAILWGKDRLIVVEVLDQLVVFTMVVGVEILERDLFMVAVAVATLALAPILEIVCLVAMVVKELLELRLVAVEDAETLQTKMVLLVALADVLLLVGKRKYI
jgi:hypothetical protein